jgi:hypothetical protein
MAAIRISSYLFTSQHFFNLILNLGLHYVNLHLVNSVVKHNVHSTVTDKIQIEMNEIKINTIKSIIVTATEK